MRSRKFTPYIRRRHRGDHSESFREAIRLESFGKDCFVMVQRGFPRLVMSVARTRAELMKSIVGVCVEVNRRKNSYGANATRRDFRRFARRFRTMCLRP